MNVSATIGGLAQLARASALHAEGHRFDSDILHQEGRREEYRKTRREKGRIQEKKIETGVIS